MTPEHNKLRRLKELLATFLHYGTGLASAVIGLGLVIAIVGTRLHIGFLANVNGLEIATVGIGLLILIPTLRVLLMTIVFFSHRDYRFGAIAAVVLIIIALGCIAGLSKPV